MRSTTLSSQPGLPGSDYFPFSDFSEPSLFYEREMKMKQYIPDITERFPEGYGGVDMTPAYFGEPVDWSRAYQREKEDYEDRDIDAERE